MYWLIIILVVVYICMGCSQTEGFQEMFGFSGHREPIENTAFTFGSGGDYPGYTDVTDLEGVNSDEVNTCIMATKKFVNDKLKMCSWPVETNKITKLKKDQDLIYKCQFMFVVTSTNYPFMLGVEVDIKNGGVIRASTQDMYRGKIPEKMENNFKSFGELEEFKVYSR